MSPVGEGEGGEGIGEECTRDWGTIVGGREKRKRYLGRQGGNG